MNDLNNPAWSDLAPQEMCLENGTPFRVQPAVQEQPTLQQHESEDCLFGFGKVKKYILFRLED